MSHSSSCNDGSMPRLSQRQPLSCRECTRRKVKCDKKIPCLRCCKLGIECSREVVRVRKQASKHTNQIDVQFLEDLKLQLGTIGLSAISPVIATLETRIALLESSDASEQTDPDEQDAQSSTSDRSERIHSFPPTFQSTAEARSDKDESMVKLLEQLVWGRRYGSCYPHHTCSCCIRRSRSELISVNCNPVGVDVGIPPESLLKDWSILPSVTDATKIIHFHSRHVAWHHNALHNPTFRQQCEYFWSSGRCPHPLWMALYLSVLSCSIWSVQNSKKFRAALGIEFTERTSSNLYRAMIDVLYAGSFLENISLYSVQAIVISTEVAHNLGMSDLNATLAGAGLRIAQCLGLHKISDSPSLCVDPLEKWHEEVERETGKRVWCQIVTQEHFAIPFTDHHSINPSHISTILPTNCDDHDMKERKDSIPTISSYMRVLGRMATLIPPLLDHEGSLNGSMPRHEQYQYVIKMDHRMRELVSSIPAFLFGNYSVDEVEWLPFLDIARHSLAITAAAKIIMVHRPFLLESFQNQKYAYTRRTCVSAAMTILREHQHITESDQISIWTHTAFCVTGAMVLGLELLYSQEEEQDQDGAITERMSRYRSLLIAAQKRLDDRQGDIMAQRGARLIDTILEEVHKIQSHARSCNRTHVLKSQEPNSQQLPRFDIIYIVARYLALDPLFSTSSEAKPNLMHGQTAQFTTIGDFDPLQPLHRYNDINSNNWINEGFSYDSLG
ncbi:serine carboxypeptidase [Phlyctema vagabunda]|uniref:Serine carboxypeptidase n=1 Tax=Phlyctema vagabunda TaxID=108571 RepID=A0ABR4PE56_9HELO